MHMHMPLGSVVQASNVGYDVGTTQFDIMIPGGGVGLNDGCTAQWDIEARGLSLGRTYGGFLAACQQANPALDSDLDARKACVRAQCDSVFGGVPHLADALAGCHWFVDWFQTADNPRLAWRPVDCPAEITQLTGSGFARRSRDYLITATSTPSPPEPPPPPPSPPPVNDDCLSAATSCELNEIQLSMRCGCSYSWRQGCNAPTGAHLVCE